MKRALKQNIKWVIFLLLAILAVSMVQIANVTAGQPYIAYYYVLAGALAVAILVIYIITRRK
jgi:hypothetical protein